MIIGSKIDGGCEASNKAAAYVREKYNIPLNNSVIEKFEYEFNCQCQYFNPGPQDPWEHPVYIQFQNEHEACMFMLRWT